MYVCICKYIHICTERYIAEREHRKRSKYVSSGYVKAAENGFQGPTVKGLLFYVNMSHHHSVGQCSHKLCFFFFFLQQQQWKKKECLIKMQMTGASSESHSSFYQVPQMLLGSLSWKATPRCYGHGTPNLLYMKETLESVRGTDRRGWRPTARHPGARPPRQRGSQEGHCHVKTPDTQASAPDTWAAFHSAYLR